MRKLTYLLVAVAFGPVLNLGRLAPSSVFLGLVLGLRHALSLLAGLRLGAVSRLIRCVNIPGQAHAEGTNQSGQLFHCNLLMGHESSAGNRPEAGRRQTRRSNQPIQSD